MHRKIRTAKEATVRLVDLVFGDFQPEDKSGINFAFLHLFGQLSAEGKEKVARYAVGKFILWIRNFRCPIKILRAPNADFFIEIAKNVHSQEIMDSLVGEFARIGWTGFAKMMLPYLGRPLSKKEISLLCDSYCKRGATSNSDPEDFYNLAIQNGHGRNYAMEVGMRIRQHIKEQENQLD